MPLRLDLIASEAKLERAIHHVETLTSQIPTAFGDHDAYGIRFSDIDPITGWCDVFLVPHRAAMEKPGLGVIVGDIVHNLRCALDYVITGLVDKSNFKLNSKHMFPIFLNPGDYAKVVGDNLNARTKGPLGGARHGLGLVEQLQPYHWPSPRESPPWIIHRFSNADKHREVAATIPVPLPGEGLNFVFTGTMVERAPVAEIPDWSPFNESLIHRMRFDPPIATDLHVEGPLRLMVTFHTAEFGTEPPCSVHGQVFEQLCDWVRTVLVQFGSL